MEAYKWLSLGIGGNPETEQARELARKYLAALERKLNGDSEEINANHKKARPYRTRFRCTNRFRTGEADGLNG
jgi:hypothetical protein